MGLEMVNQDHFQGEFVSTIGVSTIGVSTIGVSTKCLFARSRKI